jgi:hypothetical protein
MVAVGRWGLQRNLLSGPLWELGVAHLTAQGDSCGKIPHWPSLVSNWRTSLRHLPQDYKSSQWDVKINLSLGVINWAQRHDVISGSEHIGPPFVTSALDGGEWSASRSCCLTPRTTVPGTHCIGSWVGLRPGLDVTEKRKVSFPSRELNSDSSVVQLVA